MCMLAVQRVGVLARIARDTAPRSRIYYSHHFHTPPAPTAFAGCFACCVSVVRCLSALKSEISGEITTLKPITENLMGLSVFRAFIVVWLVVIQKISSGEGDVYGKNYISWDDLKVDKLATGLNDGDDKYEQRQVIVVDKNGWGDSLTVQGAVDMVPEHNKRRVKIYIHPGIYR